MKITYADLLIISSDLSKLSSIQDALKSLALYRATIVNSFVEAQSLFTQRPFDLALLDIDLVSAETPFTFSHKNSDLQLPLLVLGRTADLPRLSAAIAAGAASFVLVSDDPNLLSASLRPFIQNRLLLEQTSAAVSAYNEMEPLADDLRNVILPLGVAISAETNIDSLLDRILSKAMGICHADAGVLYLLTPKNSLRAAVARIQSRQIAMGGDTGQPITLADIPLYNDLGEPNGDTPATWVALEGQTINIENVSYMDSGFDPGCAMQFDRDTDYKTVSCLTVPLRNGSVMGVMTLLNAQNQETGANIPFSSYHELVAESLASQATVVIHNRRLQERETALLYYKRELDLGRSIQKGFFPDKLPRIENWALASRFDAAREVSGDFYDVFELPNGKLGFVVADVCDKGIVAALFMALLRSLIRAFIQQHYFLMAKHAVAGIDTSYSPFRPTDEAAILNAIQLTNEYMIQNHANTYMFATLFLGGLDPVTGELLYVNAGHLPALLQGKNETKRLLPTGPAVGLLPDANYALERAQINANDTLLVYTDGITEARPENGKMLGEDRLIALLEEYANATPEQLLDVLETAVYTHTGSNELADDLTMLAIKHSAETP